GAARHLHAPPVASRSARDEARGDGAGRRRSRRGPRLVIMRLPLRSKLMLIAAVPLGLLAVATLWTVNRTVTDQVQRSIRDDLRRASAVFESMLASRARTLEIESQTIAQDPKFFSVLTLPGGASDPELRATIAGVARDFNALTESDLFEVYNREGAVVASVGREALHAASSVPLAREALTGRPQTGVIIDHDGHYQASATPPLPGRRHAGGGRGPGGGRAAPRLAHRSRSGRAAPRLHAQRGQLLRGPDRHRHHARAAGRAGRAGGRAPEPSGGRREPDGNH